MRRSMILAFGLAALTGCISVDGLTGGDLDASGDAQDPGEADGSTRGAMPGDASAADADGAHFDTTIPDTSTPDTASVDTSPFPDAPPCDTTACSCQSHYACVGCCEQNEPYGVGAYLDYVWADCACPMGECIAQCGPLLCGMPPSNNTSYCAACLSGVSCAQAVTDCSNDTTCGALGSCLMSCPP